MNNKELTPKLRKLKNILQTEETIKKNLIDFYYHPNVKNTNANKVLERLENKKKNLGQKLIEKRETGMKLPEPLKPKNNNESNKIKVNKPTNNNEPKEPFTNNKKNKYFNLTFMEPTNEEIKEMEMRKEKNKKNKEIKELKNRVREIDILKTQFNTGLFTNKKQNEYQKEERNLLHQINKLEGRKFENIKPNFTKYQFKKQ